MVCLPGQQNYSSIHMNRMFTWSALAHISLYKGWALDQYLYNAVYINHLLH
jgi:hypothetical protein